MADARTLVDALLGRNQPALASEVRGEGGALSFVPRQQTYAQSFMNALRNIPQAIQQGFQGNAFGTAEPNNAVSDLERQRFWRGSVMGVPEDVKSRNMERALSIALAAPTMPSKIGYHATTAPFDAFDFSKAGSSSLHNSATTEGAWFASSPKTAEIHVADDVFDRYPINKYGPSGAGIKSIGIGGFKDGAHIRKEVLNFSNPLTLSNADGQKLLFGSGDFREGGKEFADLARRAKELGHDAIVIKGNPMSSALELRSDNFFVLDKNVIKPK